MAFSENSKNGVLYMTSDKLAVCHAFTTRLGGVSTGTFSSLNLSVSMGDIPENVSENYRRICCALGICKDDLVFSNQVHRDDVRIVTKEDRHELFTDVPFEADALVTAQADVPLIIFTADCTPILLFDPICKVIAAVHSGWRGTALAIVAKTVRVMCEKFGCRPENIAAAVGPCICVDCYETGDGVPNALRAVLGDDTDLCRIVINGKAHTDLKRANMLILQNAGILPENIDISEECTCCSHDKYWSHRYTHGVRGSQASIICMKGN